MQKLLNRECLTIILLYVMMSRQVQGCPFTNYEEGLISV
jgi:hypothetical protein